MPGPFSITTPTNTVTLSADRQGSASFLVTNASGRPIRGRALLRWVPDNPAAATWLSLDGAAERDYPIAGTQQYAVRVAVPPEAPAGPVTFRLDMQDVEHADDPLEGQTVTLTVPPPVAPKPFPWWVLAVVAAVLVAGLAGYLLLGRKATVPADLAGLSVVAAQDRLKAAGLKPADTTTTAPSATVPKDSVAGSDPAGGKSVGKGSAVTLIVSSGPKMVPVPDLSGSEDDVKGRLTTAGLVYDGTEEAFNAAPTGQVFALTAGGQTYKAGDPLASGSRVKVQKSRGPETVTIPADIINQDFAAVYNRLAGLSINVSRPYDNNVAAGRILSTTPPAGSAVPKGSAITVSVSAGPCRTKSGVFVRCVRLSDVFISPNVRLNFNVRDLIPPVPGP